MNKDIKKNFEKKKSRHRDCFARCKNIHEETVVSKLNSSAQEELHS